jgi:elongation factor P
LAIGPLSTTHVILYAKPQEKVINMASPTDIRKGRVMVYQGAPHLVLEMQHRTQGRQAGFVQTTLRNLQSGSTTTTKFRSTDNVEFMHTTTQKLEFSYKDTEGHHFMDLETYEDTVLPSEIIGEDDYFWWKVTPMIFYLLTEKLFGLNYPLLLKQKLLKLLKP